MPRGSGSTRLYQIFRSTCQTHTEGAVSCRGWGGRRGLRRGIRAQAALRSLAPAWWSVWSIAIKRKEPPEAGEAGRETPGPGPVLGADSRILAPHPHPRGSEGLSPCRKSRGASQLRVGLLGA